MYITVIVLHLQPFFILLNNFVRNLISSYYKAWQEPWYHICIGSYHMRSINPVYTFPPDSIRVDDLFINVD